MELVGVVQLRMINNFQKICLTNSQSFSLSVAVNGTTGEGLSMTVDERKEVTMAWLHNREKFEHMIIHIGAGNLRESQELVSEAPI